MKTIKIIFLSAFIFFTSQSLRAEFIKAELQVSGLTCSMCQLATQKSLKTIGFISDIKPDLNRNVYVLTFKKGVPVNLDLIKKKVKDAGFSVSKLVASFRFDNVKISNNFHYNYGGNIYHFMGVPQKLLNGATQITILDKDFTPSAQHKKLAANTTYGCFKSGKMGSSRVYHVTI